jgi:4-carboxymuconolactone decarboxylase
MARIVAPTALTPEQQPVADRIAKALGAPSVAAIGGPSSAWIHCPELAERLFEVADYFRKAAVIPSRLRLLAVLVTIRHWGADFPWTAQLPQALAAGLAPDVVTAIGDGKRPDFTDPDEAAVYDFAIELLERHAVSDARHASTLARLGEKALVELVAVIGHFTTVSLTTIAFDIQPRKAASVPLKRR